MQEVKELCRGEISVKRLRKFLRGLEEIPVESDTEEEDILRDAIPLRIHIPGARGRGSLAAEVSASIYRMWLNMVSKPLI